MIKNKKGFTRLEIVLAIFVVGLLAVLAVTKFNKTMAQNQLEKTSWNLMKELAGIRPIVLKNDRPVLVEFSNTQCNIYVDEDEDDSPEDEELLTVIQIPSPIVVGISDGLQSGPTGMPFSFSGIGGDWNTLMVVDNDAIGTINNGSIYLKATKLNNITYCIGITSTMQTLKIYKWEGSSWIAL